MRVHQVDENLEKEFRDILASGKMLFIFSTMSGLDDRSKNYGGYHHETKTLLNHGFVVTGKDREGKYSIHYTDRVWCPKKGTVFLHEIPNL